jgi:type 1 glutamine amidotransferase
MNPASLRVSLRFAGLLLVFACLAGSLGQRLTAASTSTRVLFLISEDPDNYEAHRTIPPYADALRTQHGLEVQVIKGEGPRTAFSFPGLPAALGRTDLVVLFARRLALPAEQMQALKDYLAAGKPLVGIRTANHAFAPREPVAAGFVAWPEFVADILGCENRGYGPGPVGTDVAIATGAAAHPILAGVPAAWHSKGNVYHVAPLLDTSARVLLTGTIPGKTEPIAWTRQARKSRIFYTSLGHPTDFETEEFRRLLLNGIRWAVARE